MFLYASILSEVFSRDFQFSLSISYRVSISSFRCTYGWLARTNPNREEGADVVEASCFPEGVPLRAAHVQKKCTKAKAGAQPVRYWEGADVIVPLPDCVRPCQRASVIIQSPPENNIPCNRYENNQVERDASTTRVRYDNDHNHGSSFLSSSSSSSLRLDMSSDLYGGNEAVMGDAHDDGEFYSDSLAPGFNVGSHLSDPFEVKGPNDLVDRTNQVGVRADGDETIGLHQSLVRERSRRRVPGFNPVVRRMHTPAPARTMSRPASLSPPPAGNARRSGSPLRWGEGPRPPEEAEK